MNKIWKLLVNRETITYVIAGIATTVVNFIVYNLCYELFYLSGALQNQKFDYTNLVAEIIAVIVSVTFAYVINARWVFQEKREEVKKEAEKVTKFFASRFVTMLIEVGGMLLLIDFIDCPTKITQLVTGTGKLETLVTLIDPKNIIKFFIAVIVIILNYVFSKLFVFTKKKEGNEQNV